MENTTELIIRPDQNMRLASDAAGVCKSIVSKTAMEIQGRKYVRVEGWQSIAIAHGCTLSARDVEKVDGGFRAIGEVRRNDTGAVIAQAEGFVGEDEPTWFGGESVDRYGKSRTLPKRHDYAIRAMAQTRAMSRAARTAFAHVVVMMDAGLSTTPAEEVPEGGFERDVTPKPAHKDAPTIEALQASLAKADKVKMKTILERWESACTSHGITDEIRSRGLDLIEHAIGGAK